MAVPDCVGNKIKAWDALCTYRSIGSVHPDEQGRIGHAGMDLIGDLISIVIRSGYMEKDHLIRTLEEMVENAVRPDYTELEEQIAEIEEFIHDLEAKLTRYDDNMGEWQVADAEASVAELKVLSRKLEALIDSAPDDLA